MSESWNIWPMVVNKLICWVCSLFWSLMPLSVLTYDGFKAGRRPLNQ